MSGIEPLPEGMEMLINLEFLDLSCTKIKELPISGVQVKAEELHALKNLKEFSGSLDWDDLSACTKFIQNNGNWLINYSLVVGDCRTPCPQSLLRREITVHNIPMTTRKHFQLPHNVERVEISDCNDMGCLSQLLSSLNDAVSVTTFVVSRCQCLEFVFPPITSFFNFNPLPLHTVTCLVLSDVENLKSVFAEEGEEALAQSTQFSFPLKTFVVANCPKLRKLFSTWLLIEYLKNLEFVGVANCEELEEIIQGAEQAKLPFPRLQQLKLRHLPKLKSICGANTTLFCHSLECLLFQSCTMLTRIPLDLSQLDDTNDQPSPPACLKEIQVFPKEWWESLEWDHPNAAQVLSPLVTFLIKIEINQLQPSCLMI